MIASLLGAGVSLLRGGHRSWQDEQDEQAVAIDAHVAEADGLITDAESGASI